MLIAAVGDTHGRLRLMYEKVGDLAGSKKVDLVMHVGDLGMWLNEDGVDKSTVSWCNRHNVSLQEAMGDFPRYMSGEWQIPFPTIAIRGNHEDQDLLLGWEKKASWRGVYEACPNFNYLPDGNTVNWQGLRIGGLGGNYSYKTWNNYQYHQRAGKRLCHFTRDRWETLNQTKVDVLLTHDAPSGLNLTGAADPSIPEDEQTGGGVPQLRELIQNVGCRVSFSGHWHQFRTAFIGLSKHYALDKVRESAQEEACAVLLYV